MPRGQTSERGASHERVGTGAVPRRLGTGRERCGCGPASARGRLVEEVPRGLEDAAVVEAAERLEEGGREVCGRVSAGHEGARRRGDVPRSS